MIAWLLLLACGEDAPKGGPGTDTGGDSAPVEGAPSAPVVTLSPDLPGVDSPLVAALAVPSVDPEGAAVTYRYAWSVDGAARPEVVGDTVDAALTEDGQTWTVAVYASDGALESAPGGASVTVAEAAPVAAVMHLEPADPQPRQDLVLVVDAAATDPNGDPLVETLVWYRNGTYVTGFEGWTTIPGAYVAGGDTFRAVHTASDGRAEAVAEASVTLPNQPPVLTAVAITPNAPEDDDDLVARVVAEDPDGSSPDISYRWYRDGVLATDVGDTDTVPASATAVGERWELVAVASDPAASVEGRSGETLVVPFAGYRMVSLYSAVMVPDADGVYSSAAGAWSVSLESYGVSYGLNACDVTWEVTGTRNARWCRDCDYSFDTVAVYDPSSVVVTGCLAAAADGTGYLHYQDQLQSFTAYQTGGLVDPTAGATSMMLKVIGDGTVTEPGYGYETTETFSTTLTEDAYGTVTLEVYRYVFTTK